MIKYWLTTIEQEHVSRLMWMVDSCSKQNTRIYALFNSSPCRYRTRSQRKRKQKRKREKIDGEYPWNTELHILIFSIIAVIVVVRTPFFIFSATIQRSTLCIFSFSLFFLSFSSFSSCSLRHSGRLICCCVNWAMSIVLLRFLFMFSHRKRSQKKSGDKNGLTIRLQKWYKFE